MNPDACSSLAEPQDDLPVSVLLVDDSQPFLDAIRALLARFRSLRVLGTALSGAEGIEMAAGLHPDVVLMDLSMPGISGLEATAQIKQEPCAPTVIVLTLHDGAEYRRAAKDAGADGFVSKGEVSSALVPAIRTLAAARTGGER